MFCKNCGKELPDSAKFCSGCGTPITPRAPQAEAPAAPEPEQVQPPAADTPVTPVEEPAAPAAAPEAPVEEPAAPAAAPEAPVEAPAAAPEAPVTPPSVQFSDSAGTEDIPAPVKKRRGASGIVVIGAGAVVAILVVVLLFKLFSGLAGGSKRTQAFAYLNDDDELMYLANLKEKTEAIELTDEANSSARVQFTADGKTIYFRDSRNALYKISTSELKKDGRPERISRDVTGFTVLKTGNVLYTKDGGSGRELNCYTGKDDFRITKGYDSRQLSEDEKTVYYTEQDEDDGTYTLYKMALKKDAEEEELLDGATNIYTDFDSSLLVYGENDIRKGEAVADDTDRNTLTVYSCKPGGEPNELLDDVYSVGGVKVDGSKVSFYYIVEELEEYKLYDLVSDSKQSEDAATTAQDLVRPDWYDAYYPNEFYVENNVVYYRDRQGNTFPIDTNDLQLSTGRPAAELYTWEVRPIAEADARERYNAAMDDYNAKYEDWSAASSRNKIREQLKDEDYNVRSYSIYRYDNKPSDTPIASEVNTNQRISSYEDGIFLYKKAAGVTDGKVCDVSDLNHYSDVYDYLNSGSGDDDWYQNVGGTESVIEFDDETVSVNDIYVLNGKEAVLVLSEDGDRWLDAYSIDKTALTFSATVTDDDYSGLKMVEDAKGNDALYYFAEPESENYGTVGDFTRYSGGKSEVLAKEIYSAIILEDSGTMYAVTDVNSRGEVELSLIKGDKPTVVSDEISGDVAIFLDSKQLLYSADGDLYLWDGKESRRVAKDVEYVWANVEEDYFTFSA